MRILGVGIVIRTNTGRYLLQERDHNTTVNPGRIAVFGGGLEDGENLYECAKRELLEELTLDLDVTRLEDIGVFESDRKPGVFCQLFLVRGVEAATLRLQEGESIVETSIDEALQNERVTDFTKTVLRSL